MKLLFGPFISLRNGVVGTIELIGGLGWLVRDVAVEAPGALVKRRGRRLVWDNIWAQMVRVGVKSIAIVSLVVFCIGAILGLQMAPVLRQYGQLTRIADVIAVAVYRELGPLMAAIVLSGFAGASIAAEIGTMVVSEEIEALETMAIAPIRFLVLPRILATTVMMICLAVVADLMGMFGGLLVYKFVFGLSSAQYLTHTWAILKLGDFFTGLVKAGVFGVVISALACYLGLGVKGGAQGVGLATTRTVVFNIVALIAIDLLFTAGFYFLKV